MAPDPFVAPYFSFCSIEPEAQPDGARVWRKDEYPG